MAIQLITPTGVRIIGDHEWQTWINAYAALRTNEFIRLLEADRKEQHTMPTPLLTGDSPALPHTNRPADETAAAAHRRHVTVHHPADDPGTWIVRQYSTFLWFKKQISSDWFNDEEQANAFARTLGYQPSGSDAGGEAKKTNPWTVKE